MPLRPLPLLYVALLAGPLAAGQDWLSLAVPQPLAEGHRLELSLGLDQAQRETWAHENGHVKLNDAQGQKVQRQLQGDATLRWQAGAATAFWLRAPVVFQELALWTGGAGSPRVDDPAVARTQGLGDMSLGLRQDFGALGWGLALVAPTGLGPWEAAHPLAANGEGRWQGLLRLSAATQQPKWNLHASVQGRWQAGREAQLSSAAPVLYDAAGPRMLPPGASGAAYLDPRWGAEGAVGVGWTWFQDATDRHSVSLSVCGRQLSPLAIGGQSVDQTAPSLLWLQPEMQARFGRYAALAGWQSPALLDHNTAVPYWGELHFRLDHAF